MLRSQNAESLAGSAFKQNGILEFPDSSQRIVESRRVIGVARPVARIGRFRGGDPAARDI
jgi:hypothetical protein